MPKRRSYRLLANVGLVTASVVATLVVLEAVLRFFVPLPTVYGGAPLLVWDQRGYWLAKPGLHTSYDNRVDFVNQSLTIGADGTRVVPCREGGRENDPAAARVFIVGDSQTFGHGVADAASWPNRLQCRLRREGRPVELYNLGVPGTNVDQYAVRLSHAAPLFRPGDVVAVGVAWNDAILRQGADNFANLSFRPCPDPERRREGRLFACLDDPIRYYDDSGGSWRKALFDRTGIFVPSFDGLKAFADSSVYASALAFVVVPKLKLLYYRVRDKDSLSAKIPPGAFESNAKILKSMKDFIEGLGGRMQVYFIPNRIFYDDYYYHFYSKAGAVFGNRDFLYASMEPYCQAFGLECHSLQPALLGQGRDFYNFPFDGHFNERGTEAVAAAVYPLLAKALPDRR